MLDRDGTIIVERHYLSEPSQVELLPSVASGLRSLAKAGFGLAVVTNQSGVGRGFFDEGRVESIHQRLHELLKAEGVLLDGVYFCPHTPTQDCGCRKPRTGMIERAAQELDFDLRSSFVVGDKPCDVELGRNVGATTVLVRTGYGSLPASEASGPNYIVNDVGEAAELIKGLQTTHGLGEGS